MCRVFQVTGQAIAERYQVDKNALEVRGENVISRDPSQILSDIFDGVCRDWWSIHRTAEPRRVLRSPQYKIAKAGTGGYAGAEGA
jgi:hypothetical protein